MHSYYTCGQCKKLLEATEEHFFPSSLKNIGKNVNRQVIGKCKICANQYSAQWRSSIKAKGLTRSQKTFSTGLRAMIGTIYIIGPDIQGTPYKIGMTSGSSTDKRKTALQTSHWMELKLVWKSNVMDHVDIIEGKLHKHFEKKRVRGEWFNINQQDIDSIPELIKHFGVEE